MEREGSDLGTTLVGMVGLDVVDVADDDHGLWVLVETRAGRVACGACGVAAQSKGRLTTLVRDLEIAGRVATLVWRKRRWRCVEPSCETRTWTEQVEGIAPRASLTERARAEIARRIGEDAEAVARVAAAFGVAWATAWSAFEELITPAVEDPSRIEAVESLGVDETAFLRASPNHPTVWATGLVDVRHGHLLDVIEGRSSSTLCSWLAERGPSWLGGVQVVAIDPFEAYRKGLFPHLSHVAVVADPFHVVRLANRAIDRARRRTQAELTGHRGRKGDPLYDARKVLLTGAFRLTDRGWRRLNLALDSGDPRGEVLSTWLAKEHLREVYATPDPTRADALLGQVIEECASSGIPELATLANTLRRWRTEIINRHRTGDSNAPTEAMNLLIKEVKRAGRGYRNFRHYRLRLLAHCGLTWQHRRVVPLRGRAPQLVA